jgi:hypothetical protein
MEKMNSVPESGVERVLRTVAESDPYFVIGRDPVPSLSGQPPRPDLVVHSVKAPLRERAQRLLTRLKLKKADPIRSQDIDAEAAKWLARLYLTVPSHTESIASALEQLGPQSGALGRLKSAAESGGPANLKAVAQDLVKDN